LAEILEIQNTVKATQKKRKNTKMSSMEFARNEGFVKYHRRHKHSNQLLPFHFEPLSETILVVNLKSHKNGKN